MHCLLQLQGLWLALAAPLLRAFLGFAAALRDV